MTKQSYVVEEKGRAQDFDLGWQVIATHRSTRRILGEDWLN